jgi:hypothetical protein
VVTSCWRTAEYLPKRGITALKQKAEGEMHDVLLQKQIVIGEYPESSRIIHEAVRLKERT